MPEDERSCGGVEWQSLNLRLGWGGVWRKHTRDSVSRYCEYSLQPTAYTAYRILATVSASQVSLSLLSSKYACQPQDFGM